MLYDMVIKGATAAALGLIQTLPHRDKVLIINPTEMVVYEYINTYKLPGVYSQGASYHKRFLDTKAKVLLNTEITEIQQEKDGYTIEIFNGTGFYTVRTKVYVDTTEKPEQSMKKTLNCLLIGKQKEEFTDIAMKEISFLPDQEENPAIVIMKHEFPVKTALWEARHKLIDWWQKRPESLQSWKIGAIAFCFETKPLFGYKKEGENYFLLPSAFYDAIENSMEAGVDLGRRILHDI